MKKEFYQVYEIWCDRYGERAISQKALKGALTKIIPGLDEWRETASSSWNWLGMQWGPDAAHYRPPSLKVV
jgi:hypothetical protein